MKSGLTSIIAIEVNNLTKIYKLYNSPKDRLHEIISLSGKKFHYEFYALNDLSFKVEKGQTIGIIGQNGSGKSTLLKIICGVLRPTSGSVQVNGRIAALLELGAGFNPEFTGRENVYMNGALMGFSREEMDRRFPDIETFAEIGEFINQPVKTYSSGMFVRLAFAVAINIDPEILIVDEALSVGDALFQARCFARFREFKEKGVTIIFVTHILDLVTTHCNQAILLDHGTLVEQGRPKAVVDKYNRLLTSRGRLTFTSNTRKNDQIISQQIFPSKEIEWQGLFKINPNEDRYGTKKAEILEAGIFTPNHEPVQILERNQQYLIKVKVRHNDRMPAAIIAYSIKDPKGTILCGTNTLYQDVKIGNLEKGDVILVTLRQQIRINPGEYLLSIGTASFEEGEYVVYDRRFDYMVIQIVANQLRAGLFDPESVIEWTRL
ncbi:MAG: ABC transporter ATP-binding protein [Thermodesulfobacteriota bacterium]